MKATKNNYTSIRFKIIFLVILINSAANVCHSASQGTLGKQSSASIEISVQVNQTLNTISPNELVLNKTNKSENQDAKPFCVAHHGFKQNASVPYELKVDNLFVPHQNLDQSNSFPYDIFLEDENSLNNKLHLTPGISVRKQSALSIGGSLIEECANAGLNLSVKMNENHKNHDMESTPPGLLILLVSPN